jgi:hypothetical protein
MYGFRDDLESPLTPENCFWLLAIGCCLLAVVCWLLTIVYWLLAIGYWLLAMHCLAPLVYRLKFSFGHALVSTVRRNSLRVVVNIKIPPWFVDQGWLRGLWIKGGSYSR